MPVNQYTPGINYPAGFQVANPFPLDAYLGPYPGGTTTDARNSANNTISPVNRYQGMQVILLAPDGGQTRAYKYWYRGGTGNTDLVEFSSEGGGGIVGDYVTTFNGRTGAVQGVSAAVPGDGIAVSAATGSVTITNIGVTYISAGSFISVSGNTGTVTVTNIGVHSFNGRTGAVAGASLGANTFSELNTFSAGISASGATLGTLVVNSGISAAGGITFNSRANFVAGLSAADATLGTLTVNSGATVSGRLDVGGVLDVVGGVTLESTLDVVGAARFAGGLSAASIYASTGSTFASTVQVNGGFSAGSTSTFGGLATFNSGLSAAGATLGTLVVNSGATVSGRLDVGGVLDVAGGVTLETTLDVVGVARFAGGLSAARVYVSQGSTFTAPVTFAGITATRVDTGTLATTGLATLNSLNVTNDATVGATLTVNGNFYVQGTLTTFNETQLLIQDKYLVLGSTLNTSSLADGAGIYIGSTTNAIAGICYSHASTEWSSSHSFDIPAASFYRVGGTNVLASTYLGSVIKGSSLESVGTLTNGVWNASVIGLAYGGTNKNLSATGVSGGIVFKDSTGLSVLSDTGASGNILRSNGTNAAPSWTTPSSLTGLTADKITLTSTGGNMDFALLFAAVGSAGEGINLAYDSDYITNGLRYNASLNILTVNQIEAIVDGGTW